MSFASRRDGRHLRHHLVDQLIVSYFALIAVLGRARFDLTVRFSAIRCESTFLFSVVHLDVRLGPRLPLVSFLGFRLTPSRPIGRRIIPRCQCSNNGGCGSFTLSLCRLPLSVMTSCYGLHRLRCSTISHFASERLSSPRVSYRVR